MLFIPGGQGSGPTIALHEAISFTRSITSWLNVAGQKTCDTRPRLHASWAVSFLPQNSISLAWQWGERAVNHKQAYAQGNQDAVLKLGQSEINHKLPLPLDSPALRRGSGGRCKRSSRTGWGAALHTEFGARPSHWPTPRRKGEGWRPPSPEQGRLSPPRWASWSG